jgi:branched-chain amino acid aminotransferase
MRVVWFDGEFREGPIAIDPRDRGLILGDGVFETIAVLNRVALWRTAHLARLEAAARELAIPCDRPMLDAAMDRVLARSSGAFETLRLTLTRGIAARGFASNGEKPSLLLSLEPLPRGSLFRPASLANVEIRRNPSAPSSRLKTLSYVDGIAAARAAAALGADDALMRNVWGHAACTTIANLFLVAGSELATPSLDQGVLSGIMRAALLRHAREVGFVPVERPVRPEELTAADAVFLTNSLRFVRSVESLDGSRLRQRPLAPFIDVLCAIAAEQCGVDPRLI